jgi:hypothetical protein
MPAWRREAEAVIAHELGTSPHVVVNWIGRDDSPAARATELGEIAARLPTGGTLVVLDHNRPRQRVAAIAALARTPWIPGSTPAARWQRMAYPTARELQAAAFRVERLRLVAGERVQVVFATAERSEPRA